MCVRKLVYRGRHPLIVIDDLSKDAASHREIALLTRLAPGRETYLGDVWYLHGRLLKRAAKSTRAKRRGSLTALPIAKTEVGNFSACIPKHLIAFAYGPIVLDANLFHEEPKPAAVDVGKSARRVCGRTRARALRDAPETLPVDNAQ